MRGAIRAPSPGSPLSRGICLTGVAALVLFLGSGCGMVDRRMTIRTNPPGALVYVDDYEIGITPVSTSFTYYGNRKIRLVKDGYETLTVIQPVPPPWYEIPPLDFASENLVPGKLHDQRTFDFQMTPQCVVPRDDLLNRAEALRRGTQATATGPGAVRINPPPRSPVELSAGPGGVTAVNPSPPPPPLYGNTPAPVYQPVPLNQPAPMGPPETIVQPPPNSAVAPPIGQQPFNPLPGR